jgi:hypothetical protein
MCKAVATQALAARRRGSEAWGYVPRSRGSGRVIEDEAVCGATVMILAMAILAEENPAAAALNRNKEAFKRKMTPYIGKEVTVTGKLSVGKVSDFIWTDDPGAVYVRACKTEDIKTENELSRMLGKRLVVTGVLRFREADPPQPPDQQPAGLVPEHFYVDIATAWIRTTAAER